jgi:hypothetical protein
MSFSEFRAQLLAALGMYLPAARVQVQERRTVILEVRAQIEDALFFEVYYNDLTGKVAYTLVHRGQRVFGYDNYRFWHCHPLGQPVDHVACEAPEVDTVLAQVRVVVETLQSPGVEESHGSG